MRKARRPAATALALAPWRSQLGAAVPAAAADITPPPDMKMAILP